jgi:vacuolar-type H+-ATPase subunit F/Vma7
MPRVAMIGEEPRIRGFRLAGAIIAPAADPAAAREAWRSLPADVAVVVVTPAAAAWLSDELARRPEVLPVVMPS